MTFYLIASDESLLPTQSQYNELEKYGKVKQIIHKGPLKEIKALSEDQDEKIIGIDPDVVDWTLNVDDFDNFTNIKMLCTSSTSYDWTQPKLLKEKGISVCNTPYFSTDSVAEYAICLAIEGARNLALHVKNNWQTDWNAKPMLLKGKTLGIIGLGHIGKRIAEIGKGIGMNVVYWSRTSRDERFAYSDLPKLFSESDILIPALIENAETKQLISNELIDTMKPTSIIVGINRIKALLDENYIIEKVENGELGGYSFEGDNAKPPTEYKGNIWTLPPIAWFTQESSTNLISIWVDTLIAFAKGQPINTV